MFQHVMFVESNRDCVLCLNCVRLCPNGSPQLNVRVPARELWTSISARPQVARFVVLLLGLLVISLGALFERRRLRKGGAQLPEYPIIDFNLPRDRRFYFAFGVISLVILLFSILGAYRAYEFTDSVTFCGQLCHTVMEPEFTAYQQSAHAKVKCVECHVVYAAAPTGAPGDTHGNGTANVVFGTLSKTGGANPTYNPGTTSTAPSCSMAK